MRKARRQLQMVFQDPEGSLNPRFSCRKVLAEPLKRLGVADGAELTEKVDALVREVGLLPDDMSKFPHQFSGGQQQRIAIARAIATKPGVVVLDEPTSALDVSVRGQIVELLVKIQDEFGLSYLLISHDLSIVRYLSDVVAVMYLGEVVEMSPAKELFSDPLHPYTQALIASVPIPDPTSRRQKIVLEGEIPSPVYPPAGCRFHTRCPKAIPQCSQEAPQRLVLGEQKFVACHLHKQ
jgi:oligopeptide/dipeptide ABC transporter ATP-binding protein